MTSTHKVHKKTSAIWAIICLLPALYIFGVWMKVFSQTDLNQAEKISSFTGYFPGGLNDTRLIFYASMAFCLLAMILAAKSFKQRSVFLRIMMFVIVIVSTLIFLLDIFQLL